MYNATQTFMASDAMRGNAGMHRQVAPGLPNAADTSSYTNLDGDPQSVLRNQMLNQSMVGNIASSATQNTGDAIQNVRETVRSDSQKNYEGQLFLNNYIAENLEAAGEGTQLMELGSGGNMEELLRIVQAGKQLTNGMEII